MPRTAGRHATPTTAAAPTPAPAVAKMHRESRRAQGATSVPTTAQRSGCAVWPQPRTPSPQAMWRPNRAHWQLEPGQKAPAATGAATYSELAGPYSCTRTTTPASALAKHLTMLAAQGRHSATLKGVVSIVRMCETLGIIDKVVTPLHWAICKAADRAYAHPPPRRIWANTHTLHTVDARTSGPYGTALVALACLGSTLCWHVSEGASVRPADLAIPWRVALCDQKTQRRWITAWLSCTCGSLVAKWKCEVGAHLGLSCALRCLCACLLCFLHAR